jgi:chemotaxis protein methyltransferase CheR
MRSQALPEMTEGEFRMFAELLKGHCGLHFGQESRYILEQRVRRRMGALALPSYAAYHYELKADDAQGELGNLIDEVTTNETYFFREHRQLRALIEEIIPEVMADSGARAAGRPVSIWCAGCASGEEPYSIAIMAREAGIEPGVDLRIYASDVSRRMLRQARQGVYRNASFRETGDELRAKYFESREGRFKISDDLKKRVDFVHLNLIDAERYALLRPMDVILCRNVIIYFDRETRRTVVGNFEEKLRPGGHLLLGHSESLINLSSELELRHLQHDMVYRKPLPGVGGAGRWHAEAKEAIADVEGGR